MKSRWLKLGTVVMAFSAIAAACGDDGGTTATPAATDAPTTTEAAAGTDGSALEGTSVTVTGPERAEEEAGAIQQALDVFADANGMTITYTGDADWESNINTQVAGGNAPDISIFPQPGKLADFARAGDLVPLNDSAAAATASNWSDAWTTFGNVDGVQYGVPVKTDLKSLVWYQPSAFADAGYEVPTTWDDLVALSTTMIADGNTPWCVGIESGQATGWTFTDWVEDLMLRSVGADVYDQWVSHDIPFNDARVVEVFDMVGDLWNTDGAVFASGGSIAATAFQDNGEPLVAGDCFMHRQASFYAAFFPEDTVYADGSDGAVDVFYFPSISGDKPVLGAGTLASGFNDDAATMAVLEYFSTAAYAEARQNAQTALKGGGLSGFLSAAIGQDPSIYQGLELSFLDILSSAEVVRFDASDLMPADVGAGTFWTEGTSFINGDLTAVEAADKIEASWPAG